MTPTADPMTMLDVSTIRREFPALDGSFIFFENAGGSQVPLIVADAIRDYMLSSYVQLGAGYEKSNVATDTVARAHEFVNAIFGGEGIGDVILGPSSTQLCFMLAGCYGRLLKQGDRVVVAECGHEANINPWLKLTELGIEVVLWPVNRDAEQCVVEDLAPLLAGGRTRLVAFPHVSNLLGEVMDVRAITRICHAAGARVVVDGVAYAPHRAIDVADWGVDWYVFSTYKAYGPHMAALFGRSEALAELEGPNHFFIPSSTIPYKFELGGVNHEGCAGLVALGQYLRLVAGIPGDGIPERGVIRQAFDTMGQAELALQERLLGYLTSKPGVRIVGPSDAGLRRVPTVSFVHDRLASAEIAAHVNSGEIGIRSGHMYSYRLCQALGIDPEDGVVRMSLVHYNTIEEVDRAANVLDAIL